MPQSTFDQIRSEILGLQFGSRKLTAEEVTLAAHLVEDLRLDNIDHISLVLALEDRFEILITDQELEAITTVADIVATVDRKLAA